MVAKVVFYICPECFRVSETQQECHGRKMVPCKPGEFGSKRRKPVVDQFGNFVSRAPYWYMEAVGWLQAN
jgi:hypothetical protein